MGHTESWTAPNRWSKACTYAPHRSFRARVRRHQQCRSRIRVGQKARACTYALYKLDKAHTMSYSQRQRCWAAYRTVGFCCNFVFLFSMGRFPSLGALVRLESLFNEKLIWRAKFLCIVWSLVSILPLLFYYFQLVYFILCDVIYLSRRKNTR